MQQGFAHVWSAFSAESANAVEKIAPSVVAVHGRRRIPSSGVLWKAGFIVTAHHTLDRDEEIEVTLPGGTRVAATLAGRDPSTDLAILKLADQDGSGKEAPQLSVPVTGDLSNLKVGHWVLLAARTSEGGPRASFAVVGVVGPQWRTWHGGVLESIVRLDRNLHPNFAGGPVVASDGRVIGIATSGLSRYGAVVIPTATVNRVVAELEKKGHIGRGYLGLGMAPVRIPRSARESLKLAQDFGLLVMSVESDSPADKGGLMLGDLVVALEGSPVRDTDDVQAALAADRIGKPVKTSVVRGGSLKDVSITVGERPVNG